jgi:HEAT repeat protein
VQISARLLPQLLIVEVVALVAMLAIIFGHALWLRRRTKHDGPRLNAARAALVSILNDPAGDDRTLPTEIERLSSSKQIDLFAALASSLDGGQRATLTTLARDLGLIAHAERRCRSRFWWRRLHACRLLTLVGGGESVMPALLDDSHPDVRAQAATWAADHPEPAIVTTLLKRLVLPADGGRFAVEDSLLRLGPSAIEPLTDYLTTHNGCATEAALDVAIGLADSRLLRPALTLCRDTEPHVRALAAMLIGALGGEETVHELLDLLDDPADDVRAAAAEALGRLGYWPAAASLALRLRDRAWEVRRAAGLALRDFGEPGLLYLRRALTDSDPFAADMARQLLDLSALIGDRA